MNNSTAPVSAYAATGINYEDLKTLRIAHLRAVPVADFNKVMDFLCNHFGRDRELVVSKCRRSDLVFIRQIFCFFCSSYYKATLKSIGYYLGDRDHTTVLHNIRTLEGLMETESETRMQVQLILSHII